MTYDVYFHDDFDGRASAAVMLDFFKGRGDQVKSFVPVDHGMKIPWPAKHFPRPAVVLDFPYHPKAAFWFDHHLTTFKKEGWKKKFRQTSFHNWDPKAPSCCGQVVRALKKYFGYKPPRHIKELARWLDIIDSARFRSPEQVIKMKEPALQIRAFVDSLSGKDSLAWLIEALSYRPIREVAKDVRINRAVRKIRSENNKKISFYRNHLKVYGGVSYIDLSRAKNMKLSFASHYLHHNLIYTVNLHKGAGIYHFGVAANPWRKNENKIHIGLLLRERYGGGGHRHAGGFEVKDKKRADAVAKEIIAYLLEKSKR